MLSFLIYEAKVALVLLVFYLFYRFLLKKETFHRFNRVVLVGSVVLSFLMPFFIITISKPMELAPVETNSPAWEMMLQAETVAEGPRPWWQWAVIILFLAGVAVVLTRLVVSILSIVRIVRHGESVREEDGCRIILTERDIDPFSWMRYIVLSRKDWKGTHDPIIAHEKAHIRDKHSVDLLLVDILSAFQWFNPAIWMLRSDLQELHEYEADDAVLRSGANLKEYQYLLIRKAVSKSGYSVANSFNHSILKNRITMMSKTKSSLARELRALYLLPIVCLGIGLQAQTIYVQSDKVTEKEGNAKALDAIRICPDDANPLFILHQSWGEEKEINREEFNQLDVNRIQSVEVLKDAFAKEKYGDKAANGVIVITLKKPQEIEGIVVVRYKDKDKPLPFYLAKPDTMPTFQGGDMNGFSRWLNERIAPPKSCKHAGTMRVGFVVAEDGSVKDVQILESVCEELDAMMLSLVSKSPKWEPATFDGHPVAQFITFPVVFQMR